MSETITLTIDNVEVSVPEGTTILDAAKEAGIEIPVICYTEHTTANGLCRLCMVDVEEGGMQASCVAQAQDGAVVHTDSENVRRTRKTNLEMLASAVDLSEAPEILEMMHEYECRADRFGDVPMVPGDRIEDNPVYIRDYSQCVMCWRCVQVCAEDAQYSYALNFKGRGFETRITTFFEKALTDTTCVFCGQCVDTCPTGALKGKREALLDEGIAPEKIFELTEVEGRDLRSMKGPHMDGIEETVEGGGNGSS